MAKDSTPSAPPVPVDTTPGVEITEKPDGLVIVNYLGTDGAGDDEVQV